MIVAMPLIINIHKIAPKQKNWKTEYFIINSNYFENVNTMLWLLFTKIFIIGIISVWFVTCRHWWRYAILVPLVIELYKLIAMLNDENEFIDEIEFIHTIPIIIPIILFIVFISNRLGYYNKSVVFNQQLTQEIDQLFSELSNFKKESYTRAKTNYKHLLKEKGSLPKEEYLQKLIAIRDGLTPYVKNNP